MVVVAEAESLPRQVGARVAVAASVRRARLVALVAEVAELCLRTPAPVVSSVVEVRHKARRIATAAMEDLVVAVVPELTVALEVEEADVHPELEVPVGSVQETARPRPLAMAAADSVRAALRSFGRASRWN